MWSVIRSTYLCNTRSEDDGKSSECKIHLAAALPADHAEIYFARGPVKWCTGIRADGRSQKRGLAPSRSRFNSPVASPPASALRLKAAQHATERKQHPSRSQISVWAASGLSSGMGIGPVPIQTHDEIKLIINCFRIRASFLERTTGA